MLTGKLGILSYGMVSGFSMALTRSPRPEPHTKPTVGRYLVFSFRKFAIASISSYVKLNEIFSIC